jgi:hypothetical protein
MKSAVIMYSHMYMNLNAYAYRCERILLQVTDGEAEDVGRDKVYVNQHQEINEGLHDARFSETRYFEAF